MRSTEMEREREREKMEEQFGAVGGERKTTNTLLETETEQ